MLIDNILSRADDETLQYLLGSSALELLRILDPNLTIPTSIRKLAIELHTYPGLLLSKDTRNLIIDLMRPEEVLHLTTSLGLKETKDPWGTLKHIRIPRGSRREQALFDYFDVSLPQLEERNEEPTTKTGAAGYPLFSYQRKASRSIQEALTNTPRRVVLHMPTGSGKTRTAMNVICDHLRASEPTLVVWLAHSEELCEQAASEFERAWMHLGNREVTLFRFWGNRAVEIDDLSDGIVVAGLSKLYSSIQQNLQLINRLGNLAS